MCAAGVAGKLHIRLPGGHLLGQQLGLGKVVAVLHEHAGHVGSAEPLGRTATAGAGGLGLAFGGGQRGHDDGPLIDLGLGLLRIGPHHKIGAAHANGDQRGVEAKALAGTFGRGPGDGAGYALVKAKAHQGLVNLGRVVVVVLDHQAAVGAHADQGFIDKADVNMAARSGFNPVAHPDAAASAGTAALAVSAKDVCFAKGEGDAPNGGAGR